MRRRRSKYGAIKTAVGTLTFDSKAEARVYQELLARERLGEIVDLECQVPFRLAVNGEQVAAYIADFCFVDAHSGEFHTVDVKGYKTAMYRLKAKLFRAVWGWNIEERT